MKSLKSLAVNLALPVIAIAVSMPASATVVFFSTTGIFTCTVADCTGSGTNSVTFGSGADAVTVAFTGVTNQKSTLTTSPAHPFSPFSNTHAGTFLTSDNGAEANDDTDIPVGATFSLNVIQNSPGATPNSGTFNGSLEGQLADDNSDAAVQFPVGTTTLDIGGIIYNLQQQLHTDDNALPGYDIESPSEGVITSVQMNLQGAQLPEPTFLALTGFGFAGLSVLAFRRRKRA